jgi:hypothetical protein
MTLTLYTGGRAAFTSAINPNQDWETLAKALNAWAGSVRAPRAVLSDGKVAHIVKLGE